MATYDAQTAAGLAADPQTPAQTLADIAGGHPELWGQLRQHPNMYPGLAQWIDDAQAAAEARAAGAPVAEAQPAGPAQPVEPAQQAEPQQFAAPADSAPQAGPQQFAAPAEPQQYAQPGPAFASAQQTYAYTEQPVPGQPMPQGYPGQQGFPGAQAYEGYAPPATPRRRKTGLIIGIAAAAAVVLAGIGVAIPLALGAAGGSDALSDGLKLIEAPDGDFTLNMVDTAALERAMGEPFPRDGSQREVEDWAERAFTGSREIVALVGVDAAAPELSSVFFEGGGNVWVYDRETSEETGVLPRAVSEARLTELLGRPSGGVWEAETFDSSLYFSQVDAATYYSPYESDLPSRQPEAGRSAASDASIANMLGLLQRSNGYAYTIERDDYPLDHVEELTGERADRIEVYGSALSLRDGRPLLTLAYDFGSDAKARANLDLMREAFGISADGLGQDDPLDVRQEGSYVVAEFEISGSDLRSVAFDLRNIYDY